MTTNQQDPVAQPKSRRTTHSVLGVMAIVVMVIALVVGLLQVIGKRDSKELRILKDEAIRTWSPSVGELKEESQRNADGGGGFFGGKPSAAHLGRSFVVTDAEAAKAWREATAFAITDGWVPEPMYGDTAEMHWSGEKADSPGQSTYQSRRRSIWIAIQQYRLYDQVPEGKTEEEVTRGKKILYIAMEMSCCA